MNLRSGFELQACAVTTNGTAVEDRYGLCILGERGATEDGERKRDLVPASSNNRESVTSCTSDCAFDDKRGDVRQSPYITSGSRCGDAPAFQG